eukprot:114525-Prymnesium_polylepis.1
MKVGEAAATFLFWSWANMTARTSFGGVNKFRPRRRRGWGRDSVPRGLRPAGRGGHRVQRYVRAAPGAGPSLATAPARPRGSGRGTSNLDLMH